MTAYRLCCYSMCESVKTWSPGITLRIFPPFGYGRWLFVIWVTRPQASIELVFSIGLTLIFVKSNGYASMEWDKGNARLHFDSLKWTDSQLTSYVLLNIVFRSQRFQKEQWELFHIRCSCFTIPLEISESQRNTAIERPANNLPFINSIT